MRRTEGLCVAARYFPAMRGVRIFWHEWRWGVWLVLAMAVVGILAAFPPPSAPECPSILSVVRLETPRPAGLYSCRTGPTGDWVVTVLVIGMAVLVGGRVFAALLSRVRRSAHKRPVP